MKDEIERLPWLREALLLLRKGDTVSAMGRARDVKTVEWVNRFLPFSLPWCGLFVGHCLKKTEPGTRLPFLHMRARPWQDFGEAHEPELGALLVLWLLDPDSPLGHVGFYLGEDEECFHVLSGNQHDTILIERFPKDRLLACRWPLPQYEPTGATPRRDPERAAEFEFGEFI
ncbi:MAG: hypothetical protein AAF371_07870 [Pseudomonadota bacterium]